MNKWINTLHFADVHWRLTPPLNRITFAEDIAIKLLFLSDLKKKEKIDYVFGAGDYFHNDRVTDREKRELILMLREFGMIYGILGSHDVSGYNFDSKNSRAAGVLEASGILHILDNNPIKIHDNIVLAGKSHYIKQGEDLKAYIDRPEGFSDCLCLKLTHGALIPEHIDLPFNTTKIGDLFDSKVDIIVNGHMHKYGRFYEEHEGLHIFHLPGLARVKIDERDSWPGALLLKFNKDDPWDFNNQLGYENNGYSLWLDIDDPTLPKMDIVKLSNGVTFDLPGTTRNVSVYPDIATGEWFSWKLEKEPNTIKVYLNNILIINTYDNEFANSNYKFGLSFAEDSKGYFDNLEINVAAPIPEPSTWLLFCLGLFGMMGIKKKLFFSSLRY